MNNLRNYYEIQREIERLNHIIFEQKNEINRLSSVNNQVHQQNNYIHQISNENKRLKDENFRLDTLNHHVTNELNKFKTYNNRYQTENIKLNDTIKLMNSEKISLNSLLKSKETEYNELHKKIESEIEKNKILSDDISKKNDCFEKLTNEHRKIKHDYMFTNSQNSKLINENLSLESKNEYLEKKYEEICRECDKFKNDVNSSLKRKLSENSSNKLENNEDSNLENNGDSNLENNEDCNKRLKTGTSNNMLFQIQMINCKKFKSKNNYLALSNLYDKNKYIILNLTFILLITNNLNLDENIKIQYIDIYDKIIEEIEGNRDILLGEVQVTNVIKKFHNYKITIDGIISKNNIQIAKLCDDKVDIYNIDNFNEVLSKLTIEEVGNYSVDLKCYLDNYRIIKI